MRTTFWCLTNVPTHLVPDFKQMMLVHFESLREVTHKDEWIAIQKFMIASDEQRGFVILFGLLFMEWTPDEFYHQLELLSNRAG